MKYSNSSSGDHAGGPRVRLWWALPLLVLVLAACADRRDAPAAEVVAAAEEADTPEPAVELIHPAFSFSQAQFEQIVSTLPGDTRAHIEGDPVRFLDLLVALSVEPEELTWLVDKSHYLPAEYEPDDLADLDNLAARIDLSRPGHRLREATLPDLFAMVEAARSEGLTLLISSAYRSYDYQDGIYRGWVRDLGQVEADRISARPGSSQHQLGTVIDFGCICEEFADSAAGRWLAANAWQFGFSLSYPEGQEELTGYGYESWHYRYVGKVAARLEREFFDSLQQHLMEFVETKLSLFWSFLIEI